MEKGWNPCVNSSPIFLLWANFSLKGAFPRNLLVLPASWVSAFSRSRVLFKISDDARLCPFGFLCRVFSLSQSPVALAVETVIGEGLGTFVWLGLFFHFAARPFDFHFHGVAFVVIDVCGHVGTAVGALVADDLEQSRRAVVGVAAGLVAIKIASYV